MASVVCSVATWLLWQHGFCGNTASVGNKLLWKQFCSNTELGLKSRPELGMACISPDRGRQKSKRTKNNHPKVQKSNVKVGTLSHEMKTAKDE